MAGKREKPEGILLKIRHVEVLQGRESQFPRLLDKLASPFRPTINGAKSMAA